jgi:hypothetical protein
MFLDLCYLLQNNIASSILINTKNIKMNEMYNGTKLN